MNCNCYYCRTYKPFTMPQTIIDQAKAGNLVLFCGAGISTESQTVMPHTFYTDIKEELGIVDNNISFSDLMQQYCQQENGRIKLVERIKQRLDYIRSHPELDRTASRFHRELSQIPLITKIITTNWDTYFEDLCNAVPAVYAKDTTVIDDNTRHVLKIHGSINNVGSLIATTEDYDRCYNNLNNGVLGSDVKTYLSKKKYTVVFIGFSFGDEDFDCIMRYIRNEMGNLSPHFYIVTIDKTLKDRLNYPYCTSIITDGTNFLHQLRLKLIDEGSLFDCTQTKQCVEAALLYMESVHSVTSKLSLVDYPCVVYPLACQDGIIHAFERFLGMYKSGEYCNPKFMNSSLAAYWKIVDSQERNKFYVDEAYYSGYFNGLLFIRHFEGSLKAADPSDLIEMIKSLLIYYLPDVPRIIRTQKTFMKHLKRLSDTDNVYKNQAKQAIEYPYDPSTGDLKNLTYHHKPLYAFVDF